MMASLTGFVQLVGYYGRGRSSAKIERYSYFTGLIFLLLSFYYFGFLGGVAMFIVFVLINSTIVKYLVQKYFIKISGHVPMEKAEMYNIVMREIMEGKIKKKMDIVEIEKEVNRRLGIKD